MKKIICIGECSLNIVLDSHGRTIGSMPGGNIVNAAALLARDDRFKVVMASEAAADPVGDMITGYLSEAGVDISPLDRFTEGRTPVNIFTATDLLAIPDSTIRYEQYPDECFDIIWPRIDEGDVIVFGDYYSIDPRMHPRMLRFLNNCIERKALLVYLPGFMHQHQARITRVMPAILENLEIANVVIADNQALKMIFGVENSEACYHDHIDFYCRSLINIDTECRRICYYSGTQMSEVELPAGICATMHRNSGVIAGAVAAIALRGVSADELESPSAELREAVIGAAALSAANAAASPAQFGCTKS